MDRRHFLGLISGMGVALAAPGAAFAERRCSAVNPRTRMSRCHVGIRSQVGDVILRYQPNLSQWCWAACMEMAFAYYGYRVPMERIVEEVHGRKANLPAVSRTLISALSREWVDQRGQRFHVRCDVLWDVQGRRGRAHPDRIAAEHLADDRPLIIGTLGHAMLLTALIYDRHPARADIRPTRGAVVRDPYPGRGGRRILSYQEWVNTQLLVVPLIRPA